MHGSHPPSAFNICHQIYTVSLHYFIFSYHMNFRPWPFFFWQAWPKFQMGEGSCIQALLSWCGGGKEAVLRPYLGIEQGGALAFQVDPNLIKAIAVAWQIDNPRQIMQLKYYGYLSNWTTTLPQALHSCRAVSLTSWHGFEINVINQYELPTREVQVVQGFCINLMAKVTNRWGMDLCMIVH